MTQATAFKNDTDHEKATTGIEPGEVQHLKQMLVRLLATLEGQKLQIKSNKELSDALNRNAESLPALKEAQKEFKRQTEELNKVLKKKRSSDLFEVIAHVGLIWLVGLAGGVLGVAITAQQLWPDAPSFLEILQRIVGL